MLPITKQISYNDQPCFPMLVEEIFRMNALFESGFRPAGRWFAYNEWFVFLRFGHKILSKNTSAAEKCLIISAIDMSDCLQGRGEFRSLIRWLNANVEHPIYLEGVTNERFATALMNHGFQQCRKDGRMADLVKFR